MTQILLRFAPSPTGYLHIGNARVALMNALLAEKLGGEFMLRIDDTDLERSSDAYTEAIREDLRWLGLSWSSEKKQSDRLAQYDAALQRLAENGRAYKCYDTPEELSLMRKTALGAGRPPIYDRSALTLSTDQQQELEAKGLRPHWRFKLDHNQAIRWYDTARGEVSFDPKNLSDPVLVREDGRSLYTLTSVVDDGEMNVSHILRGEDHVSNTATQIQLFEALGFAVPEFAHLPLLVGADGKPLSKRDASSAVRGLRDELGYEPETIASYLIALGTSIAAEPMASLSDLRDDFDLIKYGKASPRFDEESLQSLNARQLGMLSIDQVKPRLLDYGIQEDKLAEFWTVISGNIRLLPEAKMWWNSFFGMADSDILSPEDREFCVSSVNSLTENALTSDGYKEWIQKIKEDSGRKGKALFMPIRLALSGVQYGPELDQIIRLMGVSQAQNKLKG